MGFGGFGVGEVPKTRGRCKTKARASGARVVWGLSFGSRFAEGTRVERVAFEIGLAEPYR